MGVGKGNEIVTYSYPLDDKRDTFARLVASGKNVGEAYNLAFHSSLPQEDAVFRAKGLCENEYVVDKINQYYDDKKVLTSINRQNVAIPLKRILDCNMSDFYEMDKRTVYLAHQELFYLLSSFFFKFIGYLFIYLLTLRCKTTK